MGLRFRKSVKIAPGVRVNMSKSGVSATTKLGGGMSYRTQIVGGRKKGKKKAASGPFPLRAWWIVIAVLFLIGSAGTQQTEELASTAREMGAIGTIMLLISAVVLIVQVVRKNRREKGEADE